MKVLNEFHYRSSFPRSLVLSSSSSQAEITSLKSYAYFYADDPLKPNGAGKNKANDFPHFLALTSTSQILR